MFALLMWIAVSIGGGVVQGSTISIATTELTAAITDTDTVIPVVSTEGFPGVGFIEILDERIAYSATTATSFEGTAVIRPLVRGESGTEAVAHVAGERVRTVESSMMNQSLSYNLAVMSDASGLLAFVTIPFALISLLMSFLVLPLGFLGSDLEILTYIWAILSVGIIVSLGIQLAGGRRMS